MNVDDLRESVEQTRGDQKQHDGDQERRKVATGHDSASAEKHVTPRKDLVVADGSPLVQELVLVVVVVVSCHSTVRKGHSASLNVQRNNW